MRTDLAEDQWKAVDLGKVTSPDGRRFDRRSTRIARKDADALVTAGAPLVLHWFGGGQLEFFDGSDAADCWQGVRRAFTSHEPRPGGDVVWTGGRWVADGGQELLFLTGRC